MSAHQRPGGPFREELARGAARLILGAAGAVLAVAGYVGMVYAGEALDRWDEKRAKRS